MEIKNVADASVHDSECGSEHFAIHSHINYAMFFFKFEKKQNFPFFDTSRSRMHLAFSFAIRGDARCFDQGRHRKLLPPVGRSLKLDNISGCETGKIIFPCR